MGQIERYLGLINDSVSKSHNQVMITTGKYAGHSGTVEANVYQKTVDYPDEWSTGYRVIANTKALEIVKPIVAALVVIVLVACSTTATVSDLSGQRSKIGVQVVNVVDGDTIDVLIEGIKHRVRYIGIDTPETVHPTRGEEPYGKEASARNRELVEGVTVYLEKDVSETDRFDRLLRYVWLEDGTMVNETLVAEGYARVSTYPPDVKYAERFLVAQRAAREARLGLWGLGSASTGGCDPAYPDVCIPPPPPDLDCGQIAYKRFTVLAPDPHRFDGDRNGVGCER